MAENTDTVNNRHQIVTTYRAPCARGGTFRAVVQDNVSRADGRSATNMSSEYYRKNTASAHNAGQIARISIGIDLTFVNPFHIRPICTYPIVQADRCTVERSVERAGTTFDVREDAAVDGT